MSTPYRIVIVHRNLDAFADDVQNAVKKAAKDVADIENLLEFSKDLSTAHVPQVVAYLGNRTGRNDNTVLNVLNAALRRDISILPIVRSDDSGDITDKIPDPIARLNAATWTSGGVSVAASLLQTLGLIETERKIFVSYRRSETSPLAEQLHTALVQRRFDVFLDRFSVDYGTDFQRQLEEDLGDKAFVLILESDRLCASEWVRHEIAYAHAHRIQILALKLPDCQNIEESLNDSFRLHLDPGDLSDGVLSDAALQSTLNAIEIAHAGALRRRREQILGSVTEKLRINGFHCHPADNWCVLATRSDQDPSLFWVTPRRPQLEDFHLLSEQQRRVACDEGLEQLNGSVVHESGRLPQDHEKTLEWLADISDRPLATVGTLPV